MLMNSCSSIGSLFGIIFGLVLLDIAFFGFLTWVLGIYPSFRGLLKEGVLIEEKSFGYLDTLKPGGYYHAVILTPKYLILKVNYLTSLVNIKAASINSYAIKGKLLSRKKSRITFYLTVSGANRIFRVSTKKPDNWIKALSQIGVKEKMDTSEEGDEKKG